MLPTFLWNHFSPFDLLIKDHLSWNIFLILRSEILGLFVNTVTANEKYSTHYRDAFAKSIQIQLSKKLNVFLNSLLSFWNFHKILNVLKKKKRLIAYLFPIFLTLKCRVIQMSKRSCLRTPSSSSTCYWVPETAKIYTKTFLPFSLVNLRNDLKDVSLTQIWNLGTVW